MLDVNNSKLSQDQKRLVTAFNAAADYLIARACNSELTVEQKEFAVNGELNQIQSSTTKGQPNSAIAGEASMLISKAMTGDVIDSAYSQALKKAGHKTQTIFYCEVLPNARGEKRIILQAEYRKKIECELLLQASTQNALPIMYLLKKLQGRMPS